jgi:hypothetical protein
MIYPVHHYMKQIDEFCTQITKHDDTGFAKWLDGQKPTPSRKTMLELCMDGKTLVKQFVRRNVKSQPSVF